MSDYLGFMDKAYFDIIAMRLPELISEGVHYIDSYRPTVEELILAPPNFPLHKVRSKKKPAIF